MDLQSVYAVALFHIHCVGAELLDVVTLPLSTGTSYDFPTVFLRENLNSAIDGSSFQRLTYNLPSNLTVTSVIPSGDDTFMLNFSDGESGKFVLPPAVQTSSVAAMSEHSDLKALPRQLWGSDGMPAEEMQVLLNKSNQYGGLVFSYSSLGVDLADRNSEMVRTSEQVGQGRATIPTEVVNARLDLLEAVHRYGIAVVTGAPAQADVGKWIADALVGAVETTVFGYKFVIKKVEDPHNLAFASIHLQQHTDFTYIRKPPDVALFHCIQNAEAGGDSLWLDGFAAAEHLRRQDPKSFKILASVPVRHMDITDKWDLRATHPTFEVDTSTGNLSRVYFNERTRDSWRQWQPDALELGPTSGEFYQALRQYEELVETRDWYVNTPLKPGELAIFDNERIMHSRTAFVGERHMEGSYMSWESISSTWRALSLQQQGELYEYCGNAIGKVGISEEL